MPSKIKKSHIWVKRTRGKKRSRKMKLRPFTRLQVAGKYIHHLEQAIIEQDDALAVLRKLVRALDNGEERRVHETLEEAQRFLQAPTQRGRYWSPEFKLEAVRAHLGAPRGLKGQVPGKFGVSASTLNKWVDLYQREGIDSLCETTKAPPKPLLRYQLTAEEAFYDRDHVDEVEEEMKARLKDGTELNKLIKKSHVTPQELKAIIKKHNGLEEESTKPEVEDALEKSGFDKLF